VVGLVLPRVDVTRAHLIRLARSGAPTAKEPHVTSTTQTAPAPAANLATGKAHTTEAPGLGRSILIFGTVSFITVFVLVAAGLRVTGSELSTAIGLGMFAAIWGGGGFGAMIGGVMHATRLEQQELVAAEAKTASTTV